MLNFWEKLEAPIIGLAPMDGITDASFRHIVCKYSRPSFVMTEFTNVEGLARGAVKMLKAFIYEESERPIIAQIYGIEPDSFYKAAVMLAQLGFDGIDINMGCPAQKVSKRGSGAGLIKTPELAKNLINMTKKGIEDWANGISLEKAGVHEDIIAAVKEIRPEEPERKSIPVSVKTRIGYEEETAEEWAKHLLETNPAAIIMHGRTLKQMYLGEANWDVLARASAIVRANNVKFIGNGDIKSMEQAEEYIRKYEVDGVLIGRGALGNPWFFSKKAPGSTEKHKIAYEHCKFLEDNFSNSSKEWRKIPFYAVKKHLGWYCKGFEGAKELRMKLMEAENSDEVKKILKI
ncbi:tRNA dihydrouridine synthase [Patescibacteria group bacterium]